MSSPKGILGSCDMALKNDTCSAMGATEKDFQFVVEDVLEEVRKTQVGWEELAGARQQAGGHVLPEPELARARDRARRNGAARGRSCTWSEPTGPTARKGWAAENYCLFMADDPNWKHIVEVKAKAVDDLGCKYWLNTE